ncbi:MAG: hypothetical protein DDT38_01638 [Firmicutes bacterium]|nr:hypothetical protein [candidate division NPL-UPA2 bacterium]
MSLRPAALVLHTAPAEEPVSLVEMKQQLRIDSADEDVLVTALIRAAREYCEAYQNRAYITQVWEMTMDAFPRGVIELPKGSLQSINLVAYRGVDGQSITLAPNVDYIFSTRGIVGRLMPAHGKDWPRFAPFPVDAVTVRFTCGYGVAAAVPAKTRQAIMLLASHWFTNRESVLVGSTSKELEFTVSALLWMDRII